MKSIISLYLFMLYLLGFFSGYTLPLENRLIFGSYYDTITFCLHLMVGFLIGQLLKLLDETL